MGRYGGGAKSGGIGRSSRSDDSDCLYRNAAAVAALDSKVLSSLGQGFVTCEELSLLYKECASSLGTEHVMCQVYSETLSKRNCRGSPRYDSFFEYYMKTSSRGCLTADTLFKECVSKFGSGDHYQCTDYSEILSKYCGRKMDAKSGA